MMPTLEVVWTSKVPSELVLLLPPAMVRIRPMVMRSWIRRKWMALKGKVLVSLIESMLGEFYQSLVKGKGKGKGLGRGEGAVSGWRILPSGKKAKCC